MVTARHRQGDAPTAQGAVASDEARGGTSDRPRWGWDWARLAHNQRSQVRTCRPGRERRSSGKSWTAPTAAARRPLPPWSCCPATHMSTCTRPTSSTSTPRCPSHHGSPSQVPGIGLPDSRRAQACQPRRRQQLLTLTQPGQHRQHAARRRQQLGGDHHWPRRPGTGTGHQFAARCHGRRCARRFLVTCHAADGRGGHRHRPGDTAGYHPFRPAPTTAPWTGRPGPRVPPAQ